MLKANPLENPDSSPGFERIKAATLDALYDPSILIGGLGLVLITTTGSDKRVTSYASENTPVFGSRERADKISDYLRIASLGTASLLYAVKYLPPEKDSAGHYNYKKSIAGAEALIVSQVLTFGSTEILKDVTCRLRPDSSNRNSFPSGHASITAAENNYSSNIVKGMPLPEYSRFILESALVAVTFTTAWARIEAGKHYPSDVIAGAVLGTFFSNAAYKAFIGPYQPIDSRFDLNITPDFFSIRFACVF